MSWLLTGGSGQLATTLAQLLDREGISFVAPPKSELDITQTSSVAKMIDLKPSLIVNCAAYTAVDKAESESEAAHSVNATGARNVASAARELKAQLIQISTDYVFSGESFTPWKVDSPTSPSTQYGKSKLAGEEAIREIFQLSGESTDRITPVSSAEYVTPAKRPKFSVLDHSRWIEVGMSGLRSWGSALKDAYPSIRTQVERELRNG